MKKTKRMTALILSMLLLLLSLSPPALAGGGTLNTWITVHPHKKDATADSPYYLEYNCTATDEIPNYYFENETLLQHAEKVEIMFLHIQDHYGMFDNLDNCRMRDNNYKVRITKDGVKTEYSKDEMPILGILLQIGTFSLDASVVEWRNVCESRDAQFFTGVYFDWDAYKTDLVNAYCESGMDRALAAVQADNKISYLKDYEGNNLRMKYNIATQDIKISWVIHGDYDEEHAYLSNNHVYFPLMGQQAHHTLMNYIRVDEEYFNYGKEEQSYQPNNSRNSIFSWFTQLWNRIKDFFRSLFGI